jgi:Protein of unknown function (DUF2996)
VFQFPAPGSSLPTPRSKTLVDRPNSAWVRIEMKVPCKTVQAIDMVEETPDSVVPPAKAKAGAKKAKPAASDAAAPAATDTAAPDATADKAEKTAAPKKEKPPAVEAKPFTDFIQQDYLPALTQALTEKGITDLHVDLERAKIAVKGFETEPECSQVIGRWSGGKRQFNVYFFDDNIQGKRAISCVDLGSKPSSIESFLIDERKITLDLLVSGVVLRLNSQKWLLRN